MLWQIGLSVCVCVFSTNFSTNDRGLVFYQRTSVYLCISVYLSMLCQSVEGEVFIGSRFESVSQVGGQWARTKRRIAHNVAWCHQWSAQGLTTGDTRGQNTFAHTRSSTVDATHPLRSKASWWLVSAASTEAFHFFFSLFFLAAVGTRNFTAFDTFCGIRNTHPQNLSYLSACVTKTKTAVV